MSINSQREFELLKKIGFVRTSGSKEELKAANLLLEEISSIGFTGHLEDFKVPTFNIKKATLTVVEPYEKEYDNGAGSVIIMDILKSTNFLFYF